MEARVCKDLVSPTCAETPGLQQREGLFTSRQGRRRESKPQIPLPEGEGLGYLWDKAEAAEEGTVIGQKKKVRSDPSAPGFFMGRMLRKRPH